MDSTPATKLRRLTQLIAQARAGNAHHHFAGNPAESD
jgi:hypothetical protein